MSRSKRKNPIEKKGGLGKLGKKLSNKKIRKDLEIDSGYKKVFSEVNVHGLVMNGYTEEFEYKREALLRSK